MELAGQTVCLIGRQQVLGPIRRDGLRIEMPDGWTRVIHPDTCTDVAALGQSFDVILLTVKAHSVEASVPAVRPILRDTGCVVSFQNGVGTDGLLLDAFGADRVVAATLTVSVALADGGVVKRFTRGGGIAYAPYEPSSQTSEAGWLLSNMGLPFTAMARPDSLKWSKLLLNSIGSAQSAILDDDVAHIFNHPRLFRIEQLALRETVQVTAAADIPLVDLPGYPVRIVSRLMRLPPPLARGLLSSRMGQGRGGKSPTMRADVQRGGPTENAYLNGAVADLGRQVCASTPLNSSLSGLVDDVTASEAARAGYRRNPERLIAYLNLRGARL